MTQVCRRCYHVVARACQSETEWEDCLRLRRPETECEEVARALAGSEAPEFASLDEALAWVRSRMPGESETVITNVAWALRRAQD